MPFQPQPGQFYRMPIFFGPMPGPRQWPEGRTFDFRTTPRMRMIGIRMRTNPDQLTAMLPDRFEQSSCFKCQYQYSRNYV